MCAQVISSISEEKFLQEGLVANLAIMFPDPEEVEVPNKKIKFNKIPILREFMDAQLHGR